jgi:hypothetical protein
MTNTVRRAAVQRFQDFRISGFRILGFQDSGNSNPQILRSSDPQILKSPDNIRAQSPEPKPGIPSVNHGYHWCDQPAGNAGWLGRRKANLQANLLGRGLVNSPFLLSSAAVRIRVFRGEIFGFDRLVLRRSG